MRYLKSFNESMDKKYRPIEYEYYMDKIYSMDLFNDIAGITRFEIADIDKIVLPSRTRQDHNLTTDNRPCYFIPRDLVIYRNKDDWFFVNIVKFKTGKGSVAICPDNFYECDQFEGLLQLLRDEYR